MNIASLRANSAAMTPVRVSGFDVVPMDVPLHTPFKIASDQSKVAMTNNVLVRLHSEDGFVGLGEAAPFTGISGDTQKKVMMAARIIANRIVGSGATVFDPAEIARDARNIGARYPAATAALEMAMWDILAQRAGMPLYKLLNQDVHSVTATTGITVPLISAEDRFNHLPRYLSKGFRKIKIKLSGNVDADLDRVKYVYSACGAVWDDIQLLLDANESYASFSEYSCLMSRLRLSGFIFEQPHERSTDINLLESTKRSCSKRDGMLFVDESVYTVQDAQRHIDADVVHGINLKLMKHGGLLEAIRIADLAIANGIKLMIGGMVETRLAMTASLHLAQAIGLERFAWLDLDTPFFIERDIFEGGIQYVDDGPEMILPETPGIGVHEVG